MAEKSVATITGGKSETAARTKPLHGSWFFFFGVVLPVVALLFETTTHFCAQNFFDPFPTNGHVLLFSLIPFSNFLTWLAGRRDLSEHCFFRALLSGMAMGIGVLYTLMFLPITAKCCMGIAFLGFGLLGLAPLLSLPCSWLSGKDVCHLADSKKTYFSAHQVEHIGHLIILVMVIAVELPSTLTRVHLAEAVQKPTDIAPITWLRQWGNQEVMLRACYERSGRATDILGTLYENSHPISVDAVRDVFYKVTGQPYNTVAIPASARATLKHADIQPDSVFNQGVDDEFDIDNDVAGESVATVARGLSAKDASVKARIDSTKALCSIDWSISFKNDSQIDREARFKLHLPVDGVVTKASITVNGRTRYATVMARQAARAIYRAQAEKKRDPLLVSISGRDEILVQSYPVRPQSDVKINLEIAAPMQIDPRGGEAISLPAVGEQNFKNDLPVAVDLQGCDKFDLFPAGLKQALVAGVGGSGENIFSNAVTGFAQLKDLTAYGALVHLDSKAPGAHPLKDGEAVLRNISPVEYAPLKSQNLCVGYAVRKLEALHYKGGDRIDIVIDGSASMKNYIPEIAQTLSKLSPNIVDSITVIGDKVDALLLRDDRDKASKETYDRAIDKLKNYSAVGGQDNAPWLSNLHNPHSNVIWFHGPQPASNSSQCQLALLAPLSMPRIFDIQMVEGVNDIATKLKTNPNFVRLPRIRSLSEDLLTLFQDLAVPNEKASPQFTTSPADIWSMANAAAGSECDDRLAKIWLNKQISSGGLIDSNIYALVNSLAIVTPISSAVVISEEDPAVEFFKSRMKPVLFKLDRNPVESIKKYLNDLSSAGSVATPPQAMPDSFSRGAFPQTDKLGAVSDYKNEESLDAAVKEKSLEEALKSKVASVDSFGEGGGRAAENFNSKPWSMAPESKLQAEQAKDSVGDLRAKKGSYLNDDESANQPLARQEVRKQYETSEPGRPMVNSNEMYSSFGSPHSGTVSQTSLGAALSSRGGDSFGSASSVSDYPQNANNRLFLQGANNGTLSPFAPTSGGVAENPATYNPSTQFAQRSRHAHGFLDATPIVMWVGIIFLIFGGVALLMTRSQRKR